MSEGVCAKSEARTPPVQRKPAMVRIKVFERHGSISTQGIRLMGPIPCNDKTCHDQKGDKTSFSGVLAWSP